MSESLKCYACRPRFGRQVVLHADLCAGGMRIAGFPRPHSGWLSLNGYAHVGAPS